MCKSLILNQELLLITFLAFAIIIFVQGFKVPLCPVTSQTNFSDTNFLYPVDIYDCGSNHEAPDFDTLKCFSIDEYRIDSTSARKSIYSHNCSVIYKVQCPIDRQLLVEATKRTKEISPFSPICHLKRHLNDPTEVINVYFIGGSVTAGAYSHGCCSTEECACAKEHHCYRCTLATYLSRYLNNNYRATVNLFNLGGWRGNPGSFSAEFKRLMTLTNPNFENFTSNDIVFLDYSANEANKGHKFRDKKTVREYEFGAEALIRRVFMNSLPRSFPTVIYLANTPNPFVNVQDESGHFDRWYLELARHYNATVWSYRDAILAATALRNNHQADASSIPSEGGQCTTLTDRGLALDYLDYMHYGDRIHPSWHVHMFQADLYAALFEHELHACDNPMLRDMDPASPSKWGMIFSSENLDFNRACQSRTVADLPTELFGLSDMSKEVLCDTKLRSTPLLDLSYNVLVDPHRKRKVGEPIFGSFQSTPPDEWKLAEDVVGRGGFISSTIDAKLKFSLSNLTYAEFHNSKLVPSTHRVLVEIEYLRTYENAGMVDVNICGNTVGVINGLWGDWKDYRVSYVQIAEYFIQQDTCELTTDQPISVELTYKPTNFPDSRTPPGNNIDHFKVIAIMACFVDMRD